MGVTPAVALVRSLGVFSALTLVLGAVLWWFASTVGVEPQIHDLPGGTRVNVLWATGVGFLATVAVLLGGAVGGGSLIGAGLGGSSRAILVGVVPAVSAGLGVLAVAAALGVHGDTLGPWLVGVAIGGVAGAAHLMLRSVPDRDDPFVVAAAAEAARTAGRRWGS